MKTFEEFWEENYEGKLSNIVIEKAFKEVAEKAYKAGYEANLIINNASKLEFTEKQKTLELNEHNIDEWKQEVLFLMKHALSWPVDEMPLYDHEILEMYENETPEYYILEEISAGQ